MYIYLNIYILYTQNKITFQIYCQNKNKFKNSNLK